jgi:tetratricopeptide (TPR) repeat protein
LSPLYLPFLLGLGILGLSVFLYLPIRSAQEPWLDWMNPETFERLSASLLRRSHGGTLDLLSKSYAAGQNFWDGLLLFLKSSASAAAWAGIVFILAGFRAMWRDSHALAVFIAAAVATFGPLFIYLANMPPNPHAVAVLEAHFLVPQALLLLAAGFGMRSLMRIGTAIPPKLVWGGVCAGLIFLNASLHSARGVKRWAFHARDFAVNALRSAPPRSIGVLREDVQLFALWDRTLVQGKRPDAAVLAQGLGSSEWYHRMLAQQGVPVALAGLREPAHWKFLLERNSARTVWASGDVDLPPDFPSIPRGLLHMIRSDADETDEAELLTDFYVYRGGYRQTESPDFFSSDLTSEYARAALRRAVRWEKAGNAERAERLLRLAESFDPELPSAPFHLGYLAFEGGRIAEAEKNYARAGRLHEEMLRRAARFRSLPDVVNGLRREAAEVWVHRGVVAERRGAVEEARAAYLRATQLDPRSAQAHYNLGVTYWNRDWSAAAAHMEKAVSLAPDNPSYRRFYEQAKVRAGSR